MALTNNAQVKVNFLLFLLGVTLGILPIAKTIQENFYFLKENLYCLEEFLPKKEQKIIQLPYYYIFYFCWEISNMKYSLQKKALLKWHSYISLTFLYRTTNTIFRVYLKWTANILHLDNHIPKRLINTEINSHKQ